MARSSRWFARIAISILLTGLLLAVLGPLTLELNNGIVLLKPTKWVPILLMVLLGGGIGFIAVSQLVHPSIPGFMALLLVGFYLIPVLMMLAPDWPFGWLQSTWVRTRELPLPYALVGILGGASVAYLHPAKSPIATGGLRPRPCFPVPMAWSAAP